MRAVSDSRDLAEASGIDVQPRDPRDLDRSAPALAALGGVLLGLVRDACVWDMGFTLLLLMFAAVILGGLGTAYGAMVGGAHHRRRRRRCPRTGSRPKFRTASRSRVLIVVVLVRPQGILGRAERVG